MEPRSDALALAPARNKLSRERRLNSHEVGRVLREGSRVSARNLSVGKPGVEARVWSRRTTTGTPSTPSAQEDKKNRATSVTPARFAVAVPKRLLKRAVDRNRVKRIMREVFRGHDARDQPMDVLLTLTTKLEIRAHSARHTLRQQLSEMIARAADVVPRAPRAGQA